jgi:uncharacterized protein YbjT (DUF2867 family)
MTLFLAGATGATGTEFLPLARARQLTVRPHVRPKTAERHPLGRDPDAVVCDLADSAALEAGMRGCDVVVSLVGTMRSRFDAGDTYESADVGSTRQLVAAALAVGVPRFLLLSSVGAGGSGAYLKRKGECERIVQEAPGLAWTIFRPSALVSAPDANGHHGRRELPPGMMGLGGLVRSLPGLRGVVDDWRAIPIAVLCEAMLAVLEKPRDGAVLLGRDLWAVAGK